MRAPGHTLLLAMIVVVLAAGGEWLLAAMYGQDEVECGAATFAIPLPGVPEASGIAPSSHDADLFWTMNDSGDPMVFGVSAEGEIRARVRVAGAEVENWEDLSIGPCEAGSCLYIADIGDNDAKRKTIRIYRVPEPSVGDRETATAEVFEGRYPDGPHDAEAAIILPDNRLFVMTKEKTARVYRFPLEANQISTLESISMLPVTNVTDADASPDGRRIAVRTNEDVVFYHTAELLGGDVEHGAVVSTVEVGEPQGEGVAFGRDGAVVLAGEAGRDNEKANAGTLALLQCRFMGGA
jgi:hypothetical protein